MKKFKKVIAPVLAVLLFCGSLGGNVLAAGEAKSVKVEQPETNIVGDISIVREINSDAELTEVMKGERLPSTVIWNVDKKLTVLGSDGEGFASVEEAISSLDYKVIPVFSIADKEAVNGLSAVLPARLCEREAVQHLYDGRIPVWAKLPEDAAAKEQYRAVLSGAIGVISDASEELLEIVCDKLEADTITRTSLNVGHLLYIGFNYDGQLGRLPSGLFQDDEHKTIYDILVKMQSELRDQNLHYDVMLSYMQKLLVVNLLRWTDKEALVPKKSRECMDYVVNFINSNFGAPIGLEDLSDSIGYSYHHFRHIFKDTYGISPKQYILNVRMTHAKLFLQKGEFSVKDVAMMCGFKSTSQFIAAFKKQTGLSPLAYKQSAKNFEERAHYEQ